MSIRHLIVGLGLLGIAVGLSGCETMICGVAAESSQWGEHCKQKAAEQQIQTDEERLRAAPPPTLRIWYVNTLGKAGYHMVAEANARCGGSWQANRVSLASGSLPPGLRLSGYRIEGTPESPGRWQAWITYAGLVCRGRSYPDQTVNVDLTVEGDALRRVR